MADDKKRDDFTVEMGERKGSGYDSPIDSPRPAAPAPMAAAASNPIVPVLSYCGSSILMTVTNKFVLSKSFNLNFFLLAVQVSGLGFRYGDVLMWSSRSSASPQFKRASPRI